MADIFVRVHSPLFFCHFSSTFLQVRLPIQFTTFKSLSTPNVQIQVTLSLLNCSLSTLSVQFLFALSLSNCVFNTLGAQILVIWSLFNCDLVTLGVQILSHGTRNLCAISGLDGVRVCRLLRDVKWIL